MREIKIFERAGGFAENKDVARELRITEILPALERNEEIILDFENVTAVTQSFIHALISDAIRKRGIEALSKIAFKNCNETVKKVIRIVTDYMQSAI